MELRGAVVEVASGVDALYLSGRSELSRALVGDLDDARRWAEQDGRPFPYWLGGEGWQVAPSGFGKYRFRLDHGNGVVGLTTSKQLPTIRVQPRAEFLHAVGPDAACEWFTSRLEDALGSVVWMTSRLDLFCDVQGWKLDASDLDRFVTRASTTGTFHVDGAHTGFTLGKRGGPMYGRVYDKTREIKEASYWLDLWMRSAEYQPGQQVWRVEIEVGREALKETGRSSPADALANLGGLWAYAVDDWLTFRDRAADVNRSRWPIAAPWQVVQGAALRGDALGIERVAAAVGTASLKNLLPGLTGYLAAVGALMDAESLQQALSSAASLVTQYCERTGVTFDDRLLDKRETPRFGAA